MAKSEGKNSTHNRRTNDAQRLAAIRWLAMRIEQVAIEVLVTNRDKYEAVEGSLRDEVNRLKQMGRREEGIEGDECPDGYVLCRDGLCAPMCDGLETLGKKGKKGKKKR